MASSVQRVEAALRADVQRSRKRQLTAAQVIVRSARAFESDEEDDAEGLKFSHSAAARLQKRVHLLGTVKILANKGVTFKHLSSWKNVGFKCATSEKHQLFIGSILGSPRLMAQSARSMRSMHSYFFPPEPEAVSGVPEQLNRSALLHEIARVVHEVKVTTAHTCWFDVVKSLQDTKAEMIQNLEEIKGKFNQARTSYLEELSQLRDAVRVRSDPLDDRSFDVVYQFEPLNVLTDREKKFMVSVVREVMKMMVEKNPIELGQVERLMSQVEGNEVTELRALVTKQKLEIDQMRSAILQMESADMKKRYDQPATSAVSGPSSASYQQMLALLEEQLQDLRSELWNSQTEAKNASAELDCLKAEREELSYGLQHQENQKVLLQEEVDQMNESLKKLETSNRELEKKLDKAKADLKESKSDVKRLRKMADRRKKTDEAMHADYPEEQTAELTEKLCDMEQQRDCALKDVEKLEKRVGEMQALLSEHAAQSFRRSAEEAVDDVDDLVDYADNLLCPGLKTYSKKVRACRCGNVLVEDAIFCRKCGTEWDEEADFQQDEDVDILVMAIQTLEEQMKEVEATLSARARENEVHSTPHGAVGKAHADASSRDTWAVETEPRSHSADAGGGNINEGSTQRKSSVKLREDWVHEGHSTPHGANGKVRADTSSRDTCSVETEPGSHSSDASGENISDGSTQLKSSVKLREGLRPVQLDAFDDQDTSTTVTSSTTTITSEQKQMQWHIECIELQQRLDDLRRKKVHAEARLLVKRAKAASDGAGVYKDGTQEHEIVETGGHLCDQENCPCAKELASVKQCLKVVRSLCSQMGLKLKSVAAENVQLSGSLHSMQESLESASQVVGSHSEGSEVLTSIKRSLDKTKKQTVLAPVFARLHNNAGNTSGSRIKRRREMEAELNKKTYEQIYAVDHGGRPSTWSSRARGSLSNEGHQDNQAKEAQKPDTFTQKALPSPTPHGGRTTPMRAPKAHSLELAPPNTEKERTTPMRAQKAHSLDLAPPNTERERTTPMRAQKAHSLELAPPNTEKERTTPMRAQKAHSLDLAPPNTERERTTPMRAQKAHSLELAPQNTEKERTTPMHSARGHTLELAPESAEKERPMLSAQSKTLPHLSDSQSSRRPSRASVSRHAADAAGGGDRDRRNSKELRGLVLTGDALTKPGTAKRHSLPR
eukprot:TRINITY_DN12581_c0_g1_i9.p1 TRINITY_DN12581_c0_g1~~TRINITY_DN12581_c0_g1_i9.p1  ORF type:complete len:1177 (+),score=222.87 TRINITY_DN12581_c0_g1_i9:63-3593(+)